MKNISKKDRRSGLERRQDHIPFFKFLFSSGKRKKLRRTEDSRKITVFDVYHPNLLFSILTVLVLSLLDATVTLILMERTLGPTTFVMVKYGITALALLIILLIHAIISTRYRIGALMLPFCGMVFGSVVIWELYLLAG